MKYTEWQDFRKELFTPEELAIQDAKADFLCELIEARNNNNDSLTVRSRIEPIEAK